MIRTGWLPSALGPGAESLEGEERFPTCTIVYNPTPSPHMPGFEVEIFGPLADVLACVADWWDCGDDHDNLETIKGFMSGFESLDENYFEIAVAEARLSQAAHELVVAKKMAKVSR